MGDAFLSPNYHLATTENVNLETFMNYVNNQRTGGYKWDLKHINTESIQHLNSLN